MSEHGGLENAGGKGDEQHGPDLPSDGVDRAGQEGCSSTLIKLEEELLLACDGGGGGEQRGADLCSKT